MINVDTSEVKTFRACHRQWKFSSRNQYHLRPRATNPAFRLGTIFHESLHSLYMGVSLEEVMAFIDGLSDSKDMLPLKAMVPGYAYEVLPEDLERYKVIDIEHRINLSPSLLGTDFKKDAWKDINVTGSIDMIVIERDTNTIFGFEHKTAKNFRDATYMWLDEQPRLYFWALCNYVDKYNKDNGTDYKVGGVYINEVKKLLKQFQYNRTLCTYGVEDINNFLIGFFDDCVRIDVMAKTKDMCNPSPGYMSCKMCDYASMCQTYMYRNVPVEEILDEFGEEFEVRAEDHLDEKSERLVSKDKKE